MQEADGADRMQEEGSPDALRPATRKLRLKQLKSLPTVPTELTTLKQAKEGSSIPLQCGQARLGPLPEEHAGNALPRAEAQLSPRDDTLPGSVLDCGQYQNAPIAVLSGGALRNEATKPDTETLKRAPSSPKPPQGRGLAAQEDPTRAQSIDSNQGSTYQSQKPDPNSPTEELRPPARTLRETEWREDVTNAWPSDEQIQEFLAGTLAQREDNPLNTDDHPEKSMGGAFAFADGRHGHKSCFEKAKYLIVPHGHSQERARGGEGRAGGAGDGRQTSMAADKMQVFCLCVGVRARVVCAHACARA